ncbi:MAG: hypothetical protein AAF757_24125 [Cyanobacteria bacterium P01_D01_bin.116]
MSDNKPRTFWGWTVGVVAGTTVGAVGGFVKGVSKAITEEGSLQERLENYDRSSQEYMEETFDTASKFGDDNAEKFNVAVVTSVVSGVVGRVLNSVTDSKKNDDKSDDKSDDKK